MHTSQFWRLGRRGSSTMLQREPSPGQLWNQNRFACYCSLYFYHYCEFIF